MARLPTLRRRKKTRLERLADTLAKTEAVSRSVSTAAGAARAAVSSMGSGASRARKPLGAILVSSAIAAGAFVLIRRRRTKPGGPAEDPA
jgi:hypothetical protein